MADTKSSCPIAGFCYKNLWHWYALIATLPFFVKGINFVLQFGQNLGNKAAQ